MRIVFTGGGTGGHFYPIIAIAEAVTDLVRERRLVSPELYFLAPTSFDEKALFENGILYVRVPAGKLRRYWSLGNVTGFFATLMGLLIALITLFKLYPDVVVSKGGYGSVPTVLIARVLGIPVVIHESDAKPGRANLLASRFAARIAITFAESAKYFPPKAQAHIARTGIPIRKALLRVEAEGARELLGLEPGIPTVLILGGSQGSQRINEVILSSLPELVGFANVLHQTGVQNFTEVKSVAAVTLEKAPHKERYHPVDFLSELSMQRAAAVADLVISRAGAGAIAEISHWRRPAILIPIPESVSHDQRTNAYAYAKTGGGVVIEEENLSAHLIASETKRILSDPELAKQMGESAKSFSDPDAARLIANEVLEIALSHEAPAPL